MLLYNNNNNNIKNDDANHIFQKDRRISRPCLVILLPVREREVWLESWRSVNGGSETPIWENIKPAEMLLDVLLDPDK